MNRALFCGHVITAQNAQAFAAYLPPQRKTEWVVFSKRAWPVLDATRNLTGFPKCWRWGFFKTFTLIKKAILHKNLAGLQCR
jgi:hypothetical protein